MENIIRYYSFIKRIVTAAKDIRVHLLTSSNPTIIRAISEIIYNILLGNLVVDKSVLQKLKRFKKVLHRIVKVKTGAQRKKILIKNPDCLTPLREVVK
jgi:hypothetical protein